MKTNQPYFRDHQQQNGISGSETPFENAGKPRLWKQVPAKQVYPYSNINHNPTKIQEQKDISFTPHPLPILKQKQISQVYGDNNVISPVVKKRKEKCSSISNFLKQIQAQSKEDQSFEKQELESQIMSILDVKYSESFSEEKRRRNRDLVLKSFIQDKRFHMDLLLCAMKEIFGPLKEQLVWFFKNSQASLQNVTQCYNKLIAKYESQLAQKNLEIRHLELKSRQLRLNNSQTTHRLESKLSLFQTQNTSLQNKNKQLHSSLQTLEYRHKQCEEQNTKIKRYNIDLNEMIIKYHKKLQQTQIKLEQSKKQSEHIVSKEIQKLTQRYKTLLRQQEQSYELKLQALKMKFQNPNIQSTNNLSINMSMSKIQDIVSNYSNNNSQIEDYIPNVSLPHHPQNYTNIDNEMNKMSYSVGGINKKVNNTNKIEQSKQELNQSMVSLTIRQEQPAQDFNDVKNQTTRTSPTNHHNNAQNSFDSNQNTKNEERKQSHHYSPKSASSRRFERTVKYVPNLLSPTYSTNNVNTFNTVNNNLVQNSANKLYKSSNAQKPNTNTNTNFNNRNTMYTPTNVNNNGRNNTNSNTLFNGVFNGGIYTPNYRNTNSNANVKGNINQVLNNAKGNGITAGRNIVQIDKRLRETMK